MTREVMHDAEANNHRRNGASALALSELRDPAMVELRKQFQDIAPLAPRACVLILGETGVGKDVLAKELHYASPRRDKPLVVVNCVAVVESLFERELFGHKKGAFTDAKTDELGYFEQAQGGTLFLDEVGDLSLVHQPKLLRIIEDRLLYRVGDPRPRPIDVRIIAATNKDLHACVEQGTFRRDLYYRLSGFEIEIPPLRMRPEDIPLLAEWLVKDEQQWLGSSTPMRLSDEAMVCLQSYTFPGNVRELRHAMMSAITRCRGNVILPQHLPPQFNGRRATSMPDDPYGRVVIRRSGEIEQIKRALVENAGNQTRAARSIGMPLRTFVSRLDKYGISRPKKRDAHARRP
jgi:two-component system, NtrC family, response regulator AtoC